MSKDSSQHENPHIGLARGRVELRVYTTKWSEAFDTEAERLLSVDNLFVDIHHIGSTAIPELSAKPVIDILVIVNDLSKDGLIDTIENLGYHYREHASKPDRLFFALGLESHRTHHLHVVEVLNQQINELLVFRDYLRNNESKKREYQQLKQELAQKYPQDRESYTSEKSAFIQATIKHALLGREK